MSLLARLAWREAQVLSSSPLRHLALNLNLNLNVHQHLPSPSLFVSLPLTRHYAQTTTTTTNNNNNNNTNFLSGTLSRMRPQSQWDLRPLKEREGRRKENGFINVAEAEGAKAKARARANQVVGEVSKVEGLLHPKAMLCSANYLFGVKPAFDEPCEIEQVEEVERNAWKDSLIVPGFETSDEAIEMILAPKRTYQPSILKRKRRHGFLKRYFFRSFIHFLCGCVSL